MGCDGGTIPTRGELVKTKKKPEKMSKEAELLAKWMHCAMSQEPLHRPIVACQLGRLYNKESVIEFLLKKSSDSAASTSSEKFDHIRGLKDVKELQLSDNPAFSADDAATKGGRNLGASAYICPVTGLEMNGHFRFCFILTCGCVVSERALHEIGEKGTSCIRCGGSFAPDDVIPLNAPDEELDRLRALIEARRTLAKATRKSKKSSATESVTTSSDTHSLVSSKSTQSSAACAETDISHNDAPIEKKPKLMATESLSIITDVEVSDSHKEDEGKRKKATSSLGNGTAQATVVGTDSVSSSSRNGTSPATSKPSSSTTTTQASAYRDIDRSTGVTSRVGSSTAGGAMGIGSAVGGIGAGLKTVHKHGNKEKKPKTIQEDEKASAAYKSLFNTHPTALNQPKAHWVTYNPQYN